MQIVSNVDAAAPSEPVATESPAPVVPLRSYELVPDRRGHPYRSTPHIEGIAAPRPLPAMPPRQILGALALIVAADVAVWQSGAAALRGFGAALFFVGTPAVVVAAARSRRFTPRVVALLAAFAVIAARCAWIPTPGSVTLGLAAVFALTVALRLRAGTFVDVAESLGASIYKLPGKVASFFRGARRHLGATTPGGLASVLVPIALVGLFGAIFWFANPLVRHWVGAATARVGAPPVLRVVSWALGLLCAIPLLRPTLVRTVAPDASEQTADASKGALWITRNALVALNALFLGYNALDVKYLWAGSPPPGVSERAYAHEGAAWLTVGVLLLATVVGVLFRGPLAHDPRARSARVLAFVWLAQGGVVALGTYRRIFIHIGTSGLSSLRILGILGTTLVVVALGQIAIKLLRRRSFFWLLRRMADAVALGALAFTVAPTHLISAPFNVRRVMAHDYQALVHAEEEVKEAESAAAMLPLLGHDDVRIRRGAAALLLDERDELRRRTTSAGLRGRELGAERTLARLEEATPRLEEVLGDVERAGAIVPFEYIRNSSIEGEIAQSEIDKVMRPLTRSEQTVDDWISARRSCGPWRRCVDEVGVTFEPGADADHLRATIPMADVAGGGPGRDRAVLTLQRPRPGASWSIVDTRWP